MRDSVAGPFNLKTSRRYTSLPQLVRKQICYDHVALLILIVEVARMGVVINSARHINRKL